MRQSSRQTIDCEPTEIEDISVYRQLTHSYRHVAMPVEGFRQKWTTDPTVTQLISVYRQQTKTCRQLQQFSDSEFISDWDFERVAEFFFQRVADWIDRTILLKI